MSDDQLQKLWANGKEAWAGVDPASEWVEEIRGNKPMTTTERLCALLRERHDVGLKKYGVTLDRGDLTPEQWAQHAIEELLDGAGYLMRLKDNIARMRAELVENRKRIAELENMKTPKEIEEDIVADIAQLPLEQQMSIYKAPLAYGIEASVDVQCKVAAPGWMKGKP